VNKHGVGAQEVSAPGITVPFGIVQRTTASLAATAKPEPTCEATVVLVSLLL